MSGAVAKLSKPVMRGMHVQSIKKIIVLATGFSTATTVAWYMAVNKPRYGAVRDHRGALIDQAIHLGRNLLDKLPYKFVT